MPSLPWRKAKAKAISKFVVDRLQSSKHGGSLVVETGFPTSVVDLFVKNRDRLRKPPSSSASRISKSSSRNPTLHLIPLHPSSAGGAAAGNPPPPSTPTPLVLSPAAAADSRTPANFLLLPPPPPSTLEGDDDVCRGDCDSTMLFLAMLKMFFVVLLAFATSKFVVGITLSAFLLLFMEYAGKHLCRLFFSSSSSSKSKPDKSSSSPVQCMCMINKALSSLSFHKTFRGNLFSPRHPANNGQEEPEEEDFKAPPPSQQQHQLLTTTTITREYNNNSSTGGGHFHEIEISPAPNLLPHPRRRIPCVASEPDLLNWANRQQQQQQQSASQEDEEEEEEESNNDVVLMDKEAAYTSCDDFSESSSDLKKRTSRRCKIKSKIKRLVSGSKMKQKRNESSAAAAAGGNKVLFSTTSLQEDQLNSMMTSCSSSSSRRVELVKFNPHPFGTQGDDDNRSMSDNGAICFSNELSRQHVTTTSTSTSGVILREEEEEEPTGSSKTERNSSSAYLIFFAMVLVGLVGGRTLAIAFTLSWCLLLKSCGILKARRTKCVAADAASTSS